MSVSTAVENALVADFQAVAFEDDAFNEEDILADDALSRVDAVCGSLVSPVLRRPEHQAVFGEDENGLLHPLETCPTGKGQPCCCDEVSVLAAMVSSDILDIPV